MDKGSISLSINAIVVVVLAFVMLGLGLTLTRNIFTDAGDSANQVSEQIRQQILDDLRTGNKPLSFPTNNVDVEFRGLADVVIGIKNTGDRNSHYCLVWEARGSDGAPNTQISYVFINDVYTLSGSQDQVIPVKLDAGDANQGLYQGKLEVYENSDATAPTDCATLTAAANTEVYAQKSFFINIR